MAQSLFQAFSRAKDEWLQRLDSGAANSATDQKYGKLRKVVGHDPLPYGMAAKLKTIEALAATAFKQKLTPRTMRVEELFVDPEKT